MRLALRLGFACLLIQGCGGDSPASKGAGADKSPDAEGPGGSTCLTGASLACACVDGRSGAQVCQADGTLGMCECRGTGGEQMSADAGLSDPGDEPDSGADGDKDADTGDADAAAGDGDAGDAGDEPAPECPAGYYAGTLSGEYWSAALDVGFGSLFPLSVQVTQGNFSFLLDERGQVAQGCGVGIVRAAEGLAGDHPFVLVFEGSVDCETLKLTASARGYYHLFGADLSYATEGTLAAPAPSSTSFAGIWQLSEPSIAVKGAGGSGVFEASLQKAAVVLPEECAALLAQP